MLRRLLLAGLLFCSPISVSQSAEQLPDYSFGVFPYQSAIRLEPIYAPVSLELSNALGRDVNFRSASEFKRFFQNLKEQKYDIALIQPFWYPPAVDEFGYLPVVRMREPLASLIMLPEDSQIRSLEDLRGQTPDQDVFLKAFKTIDSCFQQVIIGRAVGCVTPQFVQSMIEEKMHVRLRELMRTPSIPNISLVVHSRVPLEDRQRIKQLFLSLHQRDAGKNIFKQLRTGGFITTIDREYDVVREFLAEIKANQAAGN